MNEKIVLAHVAAEVMAKFAMVSGDIVQADELESKGSRFVNVEISCDSQGVLKLGMTADERFVTMFAASSLGKDETDAVTIQNRNDACKELMNMICGYFIAAFKKNGFEGAIGLPQILEINVEKWKELLKKDGVGFLVEGYPVYYYFEKE